MSRYDDDAPLFNEENAPLFRTGEQETGLIGSGSYTLSPHAKKIFNNIDRMGITDNTPDRFSLTVPMPEIDNVPSMKLAPMPEIRFGENVLSPNAQNLHLLIDKMELADNGLDSVLNNTPDNTPISSAQLLMPAVIQQPALSDATRNLNFGLVPSAIGVKDSQTSTSSLNEEFDRLLSKLAPPLEKIRADNERRAKEYANLSLLESWGKPKDIYLAANTVVDHMNKGTEIGQDSDPAYHAGTQSTGKSRSTCNGSRTTSTSSETATKSTAGRTQP